MFPRALAKKTLLIASVVGLLIILQWATAQEEAVREKIAAAIVIPDMDGRVAAILDLKKKPSPELVEWLEKWKEGVVFIYEADDGTIVPVLMGDKIESTRKVTVLHQGHVLAEGPVDKVQSDERVIEVYLGRKSKVA